PPQARGRSQVAAAVSTHVDHGAQRSNVPRGREKPKLQVHSSSAHFLLHAGMCQRTGGLKRWIERVSSELKVGECSHLNRGVVPTRTKARHPIDEGETLQWSSSPDARPRQSEFQGAVWKLHQTWLFRSFRSTRKKRDAMNSFSGSDSCACLR
ncbi:MAG: hypothetical protein ACI9KE_002327, partial [Polyangiales bacterium]